jgi:hypothetical protein
VILSYGFFQLSRKPLRPLNLFLGTRNYQHAMRVDSFWRLGWVESDFSAVLGFITKNFLP